MLRVTERWRSAADLDALRFRAGVYRHIRDFFFERGVLEVETPILSAAGNTDPNIASFQLDFSGPAQGGSPRRWLRTSPEFPLKRLLACGIGDCYELGKVFRDGEYGSRHNPEFSMLEWYRVGWDHRRLIDECIELTSGLFAGTGRRLEVFRTSYRELFLSGIGVDPLADSGSRLQEVVGARIDMRLDGLSRDDLLDLLLTHVIEPAMPEHRLTVIHDFPASQCALAKIRPDDPPVAERFELYVGAIELANGYHELNDAVEQRRRFANDLQRRRQQDGYTPAMDENLLAALPHMPDCAGVAMGVDRLMMALQRTESLAETVAFDFSRA